MDYKDYLDSYSRFVDDCQWKTIQDNPDWAIKALMSEVGEYSQMLEKAQRKGNKYTKEDYMSELGDIMWNLTNLCRLHDISLDELMEYNVQKLSARQNEASSSG